jgi:hypothetical protein
MSKRIVVIQSFRYDVLGGWWGHKEIPVGIFGCREWAELWIGQQTKEEGMSFEMFSVENEPEIKNENNS